MMELEMGYDKDRNPLFLFMVVPQGVEPRFPA
jgi:hypothetical protein